MRTRLFHRAHFDYGWRRARQALAGALRDQAGQDLIEYGLLAGLIAIVAIGAVQLAGVQVAAMWTYVKDGVTALAAMITALL